MSQRIAPCLWFDDRAEEAVTLYTSIFPNSKILSAGGDARAQRAMPAMMSMKKLDIAALVRASEG